MKSTCLAVLAAVSVATPASADLMKLANYNLTGAAGNEALWGGTGDSNVSSVNLVRGGGLVASAAANSFSASGWTGEATDYFSFGFIVDDGFVADLASLSIGTRSSGTGPGTVGVYYNGDNFTTAVGTITQGSGTNVNTVIDLSGLTNLTGLVEFRVMAIGTNSAGGGTTSSSGTLRLTNFFEGGVNQNGFFVLGNTTEIPAPAVGALLALAGVVGRRRR